MRSYFDAMEVAKYLGVIAVAFCYAHFEIRAGEGVSREANNGNLLLENVPEIPDTLVKELNRYQNMRGAALANWSASGESIYIRTRFGEFGQLHRVDMAGGARHQLSYFRESFRGAARHPKRDTFLVGLDRGGSEFYQIHALDFSEASAPRLLTDGDSRNSSFVWSRDGGRFAYASTRRNGDSIDVWSMDPARPESARVVMETEDGGGLYPIDWDADGERVLVLKYVNNQDSRIHLLNLSDGKSRLLEGYADGESAQRSSNFAFGFDETDQGYFIGTNQKSDFNQLAHRKIGSDELTIITNDIPWDVSGFAMSEDRERAAFTVNEGGMNSLYLLDARTFDYRKVEGLPIGLIGGLSFDPQGKRLAMVLNNAQSASDVYVLDLGDDSLAYGEIERWTYSETGGLDASAFSLPELVSVDSFDGIEVPAFVYKPKGEGPFPVVIRIHGGPESQFRPSFSSSIQMTIDTIGAAVIAPNVRGSSGYGIEYQNLDNGYLREDSVKDIGAILDWIETQDDLDANRVGVIGGSYGGYMALACATHYSDRLAAAVDVVGISNFVTFLENTKSYRRDMRRGEYGDERDPKMRAFLDSISPSNHVDRIEVPLFVVQGLNDPRVPVTEAEQMVQAMRASDKPVWYLLGRNEGHGFRKKENRDVYEQAVLLFFQEFL